MRFVLPSGTAASVPDDQHVALVEVANVLAEILARPVVGGFEAEVLNAWAAYMAVYAPAWAKYYEAIVDADVAWHASDAGHEAWEAFDRVVGPAYAELVQVEEAAWAKFVDARKYAYATRAYAYVVDRS